MHTCLCLVLPGNRTMREAHVVSVLAECQDLTNGRETLPSATKLSLFSVAVLLLAAANFA